MIALQPSERTFVTDYIREISGISLDDSKGYLIEGRLSSLAEQYGCRDYRTLISRARSESCRTLERRMIDAITTNETLFFRDSAPFELLRHKIVPDLIDRQRRQGKLRIRIWSAACSTGQEIYSLAILLKELLGEPDRYGVSILGTDISDAAIARASKGIFSQVEIARGLPAATRAKYFASRDGNNWQIRDELRAFASFKRMNLTEDFAALGKFDIILCRNVAIYFGDSDRRMLFSRIHRALENGAYLMVGAMESLAGMPQFESKSYLRSVYYQAKM
jgi:chemotaxis protein methyltransferase CheR